MSRTRGQGSVFQRYSTDENSGDKVLRSPNWYVSYYDARGRQVEESAGTASKTRAERLLRRRLEAVSRGENPGEVRGLKYEDMRSLLIADYTDKQFKSLKTLADGTETIWNLKPLDEFFSGMRVLAIGHHLDGFVDKRREAGVAGGTINRSLQLLSRMFHLLKQRKRLDVPIPYFPKQKENPPREGFVEDRDFRSLLSALPRDLHPLALFCYYTGVRYGEAVSIRWTQVNLERREITLGAAQTKNGEPRIAPLTDELASMLGKMFRSSGTVFSVRNFRKEWEKACVKIGLGAWTCKACETTSPRMHCPKCKKRRRCTYSGLKFHDFRRSAVRNLADIGVQEKVVMSISGHKTRAIYDRYNIVSTRQVHEAMRLRENNGRTTEVATK
jgi:integrase